MADIPWTQIIALGCSVYVIAWALMPRRRYKGLVRVVLMTTGPYKDRYTVQWRDYIWSDWYYSGAYYEYQHQAGYAADAKMKELRPPKVPKPFKVVER